MTTVTPVVQVPTEDLKALFDIAVGSLNFSSGFLDSEEVEVLRRTAVLIGVDPMVGTPKEFALRMPHPFASEDPGTLERYPNLRDCCRYCDRREREAPHPATGEVRAP